MEYQRRGSILGVAEAGRCHTAKASEAGSRAGGRGPGEIVCQNEVAKVCHVIRLVALVRPELLV